MKTLKIATLLVLTALLVALPQERPVVAQAAPKGEKTAEGMRYKFTSAHGEGFVLLSREANYLRADIETVLPYDAGNGLRYGGSATELILSVDGVSGRRLLAFPQRAWQPDPNLPQYRIEAIYEKDKPARLADGLPSFAISSNVKFGDRFRVTMWVDLRRVLTTGNTPDSVARTWKIGVVSGTTEGTAKFPEGIDVSDPAAKPDALLTVNIAELPERTKPRSDPFNAAVQRENNLLQDLRRAAQHLQNRQWKSGFDAYKEVAKQYPEHLTPRYVLWILAERAAFLKEDTLPLLKDYYEACPGQMPVLNDYLNALITNNKDQDAFTLYGNVASSPLGAVPIRRVELDINWGFTLINNGYSSRAETLMATLGDNPLVKNDGVRRVQLKFMRIKILEAKGDSKAAAAAYQTLLTEEKEALFPRGEKSQMADYLESMHAMHVNTANQWDEELIFRQEEAKKQDKPKERLPRVTFDTTKGKIVVELFQDDAPNTVASIVSLVRRKFYDGHVFHRYVPAFMAQGGDPAGDGSGGPGYRLKSEASPDNRRNFFRGTMGMACLSPGTDTEGSQFFLCTHNSASVMGASGKYVAVGRVIEGLEVLDMLRKGDKIKTATVSNLREGSKYEPVTIKP